MNKKHNLIYYIVLKIKVSKKLLDPKVFELAKESISLCANSHKWNIIEMSLRKTQLDLLVHLPISMSVDNAVKILKNENKMIPWALGYSVETVGDLDLSNCKLCLKNKAKNNENGIPL